MDKQTIDYPITCGKNLNNSRIIDRYFVFLSYQLDVISHLVVRNFIVQYKGALLGVLWAIFVPLSQILVLAFIFGRVVPLGIKGYPAFLIIGILPWNWFSLCLTSAGLLFIGNRDLMLRANFVPLNLVIVDVLINLLGFLLLLPILFLLLIIYHCRLTLYIIYLPLILFFQALLTIGISLIIATLNVFYRDIKYLVTIIIMLLFFITPIFYGSGKIDPSYQFIYKYNPMAVLINTYKTILFYGLPPDRIEMLYLIIFSVLTCFVGYIIYYIQLHKIYDLI